MQIPMIMTERLKDMINIFDILQHLKTDIIPQYDSEFDMYQTKRTGGTVLEFNFYYNEVDDDYSKGCKNCVRCAKSSSRKGLGKKPSEFMIRCDGNRLESEDYFKITCIRPQNSEKV